MEFKISQPQILIFLLCYTRVIWNSISFLIIEEYKCTLLRSIEQITIIGGHLLYSIVLASATHQHELATGTLHRLSTSSLLAPPTPLSPDILDASSF